MNDQVKYEDLTPEQKTKLDLDKELKHVTRHHIDGRKLHLDKNGNFIYCKRAPTSHLKPSLKNLFPGLS
jgi:hypothetical protein